MHFNIVTVFTPSERQTLKKQFQTDQKRKALLASTVYLPKYSYHYNSKYKSYTYKYNNNNKPLNNISQKDN